MAREMTEPRLDPDWLAFIESDERDEQGWPLGFTEWRIKHGVKVAKLEHRPNNRLTKEPIT
jgi:hypothetical protein